MNRSIAFVVVLAGCYAPETPDCTLACAADTDCVSGQVCTSDHFCAANSAATCANGAVSDGGTPATSHDAAMTDAGTTTEQVQVNIIIAGGGSVATSIGAECPSGTCSYMVAKDTAVTLTAIDHGANKFKQWTSTCSGGNRSCQFTASAAVTTASAMFGH